MLQALSVIRTSHNFIGQDQLMGLQKCCYQLAGNNVSEMGCILSQCRQVISSFPYYKACFIRRQTNLVAHDYTFRGYVIVFKFSTVCCLYCWSIEFGNLIAHEVARTIRGYVSGMYYHAFRKIMHVWKIFLRIYKFFEN